MKMSEDKINEILKAGIYGSPETLPEERNFFLHTIRERIYLALTNNQVRKKGVYPEIVKMMKKNKEQSMKLLINGDLNYPAYSNYIQEANKHGVPFKIVSNDEDTPMGLILTSNEALSSQGEIFIKDDDFHVDFKR